MHSFPQLVGKKFGELMGYFPNCTLYGLIKRKEHKCYLNPDPELVVGPEDELIMLRDRLNLLAQLQPLATPVPIDLGGAHLHPLPPFFLPGWCQRPRPSYVFQSTFEGRWRGRGRGHQVHSVEEPVQQHVAVSDRSRCCQ